MKVTTCGHVPYHAKALCKRCYERKQMPKHVAYLRKKKFGVTQAEFDLRLQIQDSKCAICLQPERENRRKQLCLDHNHRTGQVRGLLCSRCNRILGYVHEDTTILTRAVRYLEWEYTNGKNRKTT